VAVLCVFPFRGKSSTNDSNQIIVTFRVDNDRDSPIQLADSDKPILGVRVSRIKNF